MELILYPEWMNNYIACKVFDKMLRWRLRRKNHLNIYNEFNHIAMHAEIKNNPC